MKRVYKYFFIDAIIFFVVFATLTMTVDSIVVYTQSKSKYVYTQQP